MQISPQNWTLATIQVPPRWRYPSSPPPLFQSSPLKLSPVPVVRSQGPNHRRKNHVETRSIASTIYHWNLVVVTHQGSDFSGELEVNSLSPMSSPCCTLALGLYGSESEVHSSSYSKFWRTSGEQTPSLSSTFSTSQILEIGQCMVFI
jgi:hypothetical protein